MKNYAKKEIATSGAIIFTNEENKLHRIDGPAIITALGAEHWMINDEYHRLDGPAIIWHSKQSNCWMIKNKIYTKSNHNKFVLFFVLEPRRIDLNPTED